MEREILTFNKLFEGEIHYSYKTKNGHLGKHFYRKRIGQIYPPKLAKYFTPNELVEEVIDGLEMYAIKARILIDKAIKLGRVGKTMYVGLFRLEDTLRNDKISSFFITEFIFNISCL